MSPPLKYWFNINSFYEASRPCFRLQKFFGLLPFTVSSSSSRSRNSNTAVGLLKSEVKFMDVVIFTLWQIFFLQMFYAQWPAALLEAPMSRIITLVSVLLHLLGGISCSYSAMVAFHCRRKFVRMLQLVDNADSLPMFSCASLITAAVFAIITVCHTLSNEAPILLVLSIVYTIPTILYTFYFLVIVKLGHDLKNEGKQIAVLVHKAINQSSTTPAIVERLMVFSRHLQHQTPVVSCGLFNFDWTLALSLTSALATYSVILIQFELVVPQFFISAIVQLFEGHKNSTEP
ncbi:uncharacterized protein LOC125950658 [Anopheles darlingi]|uniref:uncharacterized protein LOC125950658 n=1 Tax=Anopheles darlingi TaxID=43151 RepID=UPI002100564D|nr:uncharacterized protein LOC125950658 [Anopheles darlingi]